MKINPFVGVAEVTMGLDDPRLVEGVAEVNEHLNELGRQHFLDAADNAQTDPETGTQYAVVGTSALKAGRGVAFLAMDAPFGNGVWPHIVARAESVSEMAHRGGLSDSDGNPIPVLVRAAPGANSSFGLESADRKSVKKGDSSPIARAQNSLAERLGFGELYGDVSFSQPSAHAAARMEDGEQRFDILGGVLMGDPPHGDQVGMVRRLVRFGREGARFDKSVKQSGIDVLTDDSIISSPDFEKGVWKRRGENLPIVKGFKHGDLVQDLSELRRSNVPTTLLHAEDSLITERQMAIDAVDSANQEVFGLHDIRRVEILGANHSFADLLGHFGVVAAGVVNMNHMRKMYEREA